MTDLKTILFLSDLQNGYAEEDILIGQYLENFYDVTYSDIYSCEVLEDKADAVLMHNTWPAETLADAQLSETYRRTQAALRRRLSEKNIYTYNANDGRGDMQCKEHLFALLTEGYPVIPTVRTHAEIHHLPRAEKYRTKMLGGFSAWLQASHEADKLNAAHLEGFIIQPHIDFVQEISVYYIDDQVFCIGVCPDKAREGMRFLDHIDDRYVAFAERFRLWNTLSYGLQRVDFIETRTGEFLLLEIEDDAPYYSLTSHTPLMREKFLSLLHKSLEKNFIHQTQMHDKEKKHA